MRGAPIIAALIALAGAARANDTEAVLSGRGLTFAHSAQIAMESEDLRLSPGEVRVAYVFRNRSAIPVAATVAFPLPDLDMGDLSETPHSFHFSGRDGDVVDFRLWVNGKPAAVALEAHAFTKGNRDVTSLLARYRIPMVGARSDREVDEALNRLKPDAVKVLAAAGAVYADEWKTPSDVKHPGWTVRAAYRWRQVFPANAEVLIEHRYRPVLGGVMLESFADLAKRGALRDEGVWADEKRGWCLTPALIAAARRPGRAQVQWLQYILKTGANWAGPIGHFHLEIAPAPGGVASSCPIPGLVLQRRGGGLIAERAGFTPVSDIAAVFVSATP